VCITALQATTAAELEFILFIKKSLKKQYTAHISVCAIYSCLQAKKYKYIICHLNRMIKEFPKTQPNKL
jgi:hypothetical protein